MKRCPECRRDYYDDSLLYCLDDGAQLLEGPASGSNRSIPRVASGGSGIFDHEPQTAILPDASSTSEAATRTQIDTAGHTSVSPTGPAIVPKRSFDKRLLLVPVLLAVVTLGGFFGYRYYNAPERQIGSIAVMPFVNASGSEDLEYLSDGVTESLINNLSRLEGLSVKARSSVFRYKGKDVEPQQIASDLKVQAVLNGRVVQRGDNLTVSLDLVHGGTGDQIWGEQYNRKMGDIAVLQGEIARDISQKLRAQLTGADQSRVVKDQTQNSEAYQLYLQGRHNWNKRTDEATKKAIEYFQFAIEKDPDYAMAYVGLAESYLVSDLPDGEAFPKMKTAALKALEIDPTLGEPHAVLAMSASAESFDYAVAEKEFRRAIELSPNYPTAYHWFAESLVAWGRFDEALPMFRKALELDPFSHAIGTDYGIALFYARRYDESIAQLRRLVEMDPAYQRTYSYLARVYQTTGKFEEALNAHERFFLLEGGDPQAIASGKQAMLEAVRADGKRGYWSKMLEFNLENLKKGEDVAPRNLALAYAHLGLRDEAFRWLEKDFENEKDFNRFMLNVSPEWDEIRDDPRFKDMVARYLKL